MGTTSVSGHFARLGYTMYKSDGRSPEIAERIVPNHFPYYGNMGGGGERGAWPRGPADEGEADGDSWSGALSERP
jgi:hypothetical protein